MSRRQQQQQPQQQVMVTSAWVWRQETSWSLQQQTQHERRQQLPAGWQTLPRRIASMVQMQM